MAHNRAELNALIFHNRTVLPLTSPGYAEMTLAVAELQGGNNTKAAMYAEAAVARDVTLAAGWLGKLAADVFEATPDDLRKDRALFCMDRALECAPTCRREIIEFFVANILGHYVEVLCTGALAELAQWVALEASADELEREALELDWQAVQRRAGATLLEAAGLVSGMVALFSRRLGTQVVAGIASVGAFSEAAHQTQYASLLEAMGSDLRAAGHALRLEGKEHRTASMFYLVPARELVGLAARLLRAEGLSSQPLQRPARALTSTFREVLDAHLRALRVQLSWQISAAIEGETDALVTTYGHQPVHAIFKTPEVKWNEARTYDLINTPHPVPRDTLRWLEHMLPSAKTLEAHRLLSFPLSAVTTSLYGISQPSRLLSLQQRVRRTLKTDKNGPGLVAVSLVAGLIFAAVAPLVFIWPCGLLVWYLVALIRGRRQRARQRTRLSTAFAPIWSADTWLQGTRGELLDESGAVGPGGLPGPPPLPVGVQGAAVRPVRSFPVVFRVMLIAGGAVLLLFVLTLVVLGTSGQKSQTDPAVETKPDVAVGPVASHSHAASATKPTPEVRRAIAVHDRAMASSSATASPTGSPLTAKFVGESYAVVGVPDGDTLNVRAGPGMKNNVTVRLPGDTAHVEITGASVMNERTEWVPIKAGDQSGWVTKGHLQRE